MVRPADVCVCKGENLENLTTGFQGSPSQLWLLECDHVCIEMVCTSSWRGTVVSGACVSRCYKPRRLGSRHNYWTNWVSEPSFWGRSVLYIWSYIFIFVCTNTFWLSKPPPSSARDGVSIRLFVLSVFVGVLCVSVVCVDSCVRVCGIHTCSECMCGCVPAGATSSVCCWLHLWHGAVTASAASWSVAPSMMYFSVKITFFKKINFLRILHGVLFSIPHSMLSFESWFLDLQSASEIAWI